MYKVKLKGGLCEAQYEISGDSLIEVAKDLGLNAPDKHGDIIDVTIEESESSSNLRERWMLLRGTAREIISAIEDEFPIAKLNTNAIFNQLDLENDSTALYYSYLINNPRSKIISNSDIYNTLRKHHAELIARAFGQQAYEFVILPAQQVVGMESSKS